ncbi:hypothetical protein B0H11DRAFT_1051108 [Mycena galericulata]|nr:hypothetical protein B0H11DRAFT_1051108 [Mycena galericulata]
MPTISFSRAATAALLRLASHRLNLQERGEQEGVPFLESELRVRARAGGMGMAECARRARRHASWRSGAGSVLREGQGTARWRARIAGALPSVVLSGGRRCTFGMRFCSLCGRAAMPRMRDAGSSTSSATRNQSIRLLQFRIRGGSVKGGCINFSFGESEGWAEEGSRGVSEPERSPSRS